MQFHFTLLALLPLTYSAYALPSNPADLGIHEAVFGGSGPIVDSNQMSPRGVRDEGHLFAKRDWCGVQGDLMTKTDIQWLQSSLQNTDPNALAYVPKRSYYSWTLGTARICIYNDYIFENTHIKRWEAGWAVGYITGRCCRTPGTPQWYVSLVQKACCDGSCYKIREGKKPAYSDSDLSQM